MALRRVVCSLVISVSVLFAGFFTLSVSASVSLPSDGHYMTQSDALAIFGSQIPCTYFDGSDYVDDVFTYDTTRTLYAVDDPDMPLTVGQTVLVYRANVAANQNAQYITFKLNPEYSIFDTQYLYCACGLSSGFSVSASAYNSPSWKWWGGGQEVIFSGDYVSNNDDRRCVGMWLNDWQTAGTSCTAVPVVFDFSGSASSCYSIDCQFRGNSSYGTDYYFFISLPYVSGDAFGSSGTIGTTTSSSGGSGGDVNVNVDVDMSETNSWLEDIWEGITDLGDSIWSGIEGVFVPSDEAIEAFKDSIEESLISTFDPLYTAEELADDAFAQMIGAVGTGSLQLPAASYSVGGHNVTLWQTRTVDLKPAYSTFRVLYDTFAAIIDIVCTILFINMLRNKFDALMTGEVHINAD